MISKQSVLIRSNQFRVCDRVCNRTCHSQTTRSTDHQAIVLFNAWRLFYVPFESIWSTVRTIWHGTESLLWNVRKRNAVLPTTAHPSAVVGFAHPSAPQQTYYANEQEKEDFQDVYQQLQAQRRDAYVLQYIPSNRQPTRFTTSTPVPAQTVEIHLWIQHCLPRSHLQRNQLLNVWLALEQDPLQLRKRQMHVEAHRSTKKASCQQKR